MVERDECIIAYRLEQVEKAVKENNADSLERDQKLHEKLDLFLEVKKEVSTTAYRVGILERARDRQTVALWSISASVAGGFLLIILERVQL